MRPIFETSQLQIFFNGVFSEPRLNHAEGIALDREGNVWCGGEEGEIYRIAKDGSSIELKAKTNGFALGVAVDNSGFVYVCDMKFACVFRYNPNNGEVIRFAQGDGSQVMSCPNYAVIDQNNRWLYVSDSQDNGPGIWRFDLDTGKGSLWYGGNCRFANGLAIAPDGRALYLAESFAGKISRIEITQDGSAGKKSDVVTIPDSVPDGLLVDSDGTLYIACFEPSCVYRYFGSGEIELLVEDKMAQILDHPTNLAQTNDGRLLIANLGAWHITSLSIRGDVNESAST